MKPSIHASRRDRPWRILATLAPPAYTWLCRCVAACALALSPLSNASETPYFRCTFLLSLTIISYDHELEPQETRSAHQGFCVFGEDQWLIRTRSGPNTTQTHFCNGEKVISVFSFDDPQAAVPPPWLAERYGLSTIPAEPQTEAPTFVHLADGTLPIDYTGGILPWLAFCSSMHLNTPDRLLPFPNSDMRRHVTSFGYVDRTDRYDDSLALPMKVVWLADDRLMRRAPHHWSLYRVGRSPDAIRQALTRQAAIPHGFEGAVYEVTKTTNILGYTIPLKFRLTTFRPYYEDGRSLREIDAVGEVLSLELSDAPAWPLVDGLVYHAVDFRFRHPRRLVDYVRYQIKDGAVPTRNDPVVKSLYEAAILSADVDPVIRARSASFAVYGAVLVTFPAVVVLLWLRSRFRPRSSNP